jgi:hypothetical protein
MRSVSLRPMVERRLGAAGAFLATLLICAGTAFAALPPVPVPAENPLTEGKRVLGKMLFWDEQLSSDGSIACGTCHRPAQGGADPRVGRNAGVDKGTIDDVLGSPGIVSLDRDGHPVSNPQFGFGPQVTPRAAPSNFGALWAEQVFWDGRAGSRVMDPLTGATAIARGGALENQVLSALAAPGEMAKRDRSWADVIQTVEHARPLALASELPKDVAVARAERDVPGTVRGRLRRLENHADPNRVRDRYLRENARERPDALGSIRSGRLERDLGPRSLWLASATSVSLHRVSHAAAIHE